MGPSGPVGTDQAGDFAVTGLEIDAVQRGHRFEGFSQSLDLDHGIPFGLVLGRPGGNSIPGKALLLALPSR